MTHLASVAPPERSPSRSGMVPRSSSIWILGGALCLSAVFAGAGPLAAQTPAAPAADSLLPMVDEAIALTKQRNLDFQQHTPWQILHGLLALRKDYVLKNGDKMVNALEFISTEARYKGDRWFEATPHGAKAHPYNGTPYDFEGHVNQTLAIIAMCDVPLTHEFKTATGQSVTMADMIRHAQMNVNTREETTWTLWFLTHYLDQDTEWVNGWNQKWSMETLVRIQNASNVTAGPCGGCHGLFALAYARNAYLKKHGQLRGSWLEGDQKLQSYIAAAQNMQNRDGSFATEFFKARGYSNDFNERIKSSGHMLEWLMMALPKSRLEERWVRTGVQTLASDLIRNATQPADCGPLYHSLHALILYKQRVQPTATPAATPELAQKAPALLPAGPVTLSAPDGESMPLSVQQQKDAQATANPIVAKPIATPAPQTAQVPAPTLPQAPTALPAVTPKTASTPVPTTAAATPGASDFKTPVTATPRPLSVPSTGLKPAVTAANPVQLSAPATADAKPASPVPTPVQVTEQPEGLKKLSAETGAEHGAAKPVTSDYAPLPGAMPILKQPLKTPAAGGEGQKTEPAPVSAPTLEKAPTMTAPADKSETAKPEPAAEKPVLPELVEDGKD